MPTRSRSTAHRVGPYRLIFAAILAFWVLSPLLLTSTSSQDGPAFVAAARLALTDPDAMYGARFRGRTDITPEQHETLRAWTSAYCAADSTGDCESNHAGYLSAPPAIVFYLPVTAFGDLGALLAVRLLSALSLAAGMEMLWRTLGPSDEAAGRLLALTAILATPLVINIITLGQNTGVMFLSASLGVTACTTKARARSMATAAALGTAIALKIFPAIVIPLLLVQKRWRLAATTVAGSAVFAVVVASVMPRSLWPAFLETLRLYREQAIEYSFNRSVDASLRATLIPSLAPGPLFVTTLVIRVCALGAMWWARVRHLDHDIQVAYAWWAGVLFSDFVWPHYFLLLLPLTCFLIRHRPRLLPLAPITAAITAVVLITWQYPRWGHVVSLIVMVGGLGMPLLVPPGDRENDPAPAETPTSSPIAS